MNLACSPFHVAGAGRPCNGSDHPIPEKVDEFTDRGADQVWTPGLWPMHVTVFCQSIRNQDLAGMPVSEVRSALSVYIPGKDFFSRSEISFARARANFASRTAFRLSWARISVRDDRPAPVNDR
jgi:hypothetical protein